jgi:hypothetical protein
MDSPMDKIHPGPHHAPDDLTDQAADFFAVAVFPIRATDRVSGRGAAAVEPETARFVDPALDEERFRGRLHALPWVCFTGRVDQLRRLATWMDSHNDLADPSGRDDGGGAGLRVVTGNSGVGKSALLGVLVCAAHPRLRESTQQLWWVAAHRPSQNPHLAAVHAHQRGVAEITASLGRQPLGSYGARYPGPEVFPGGEVFPADARTPAEPIVAIAGLAVRPVIVLDALDERTTARPGIEGHRMTGHVDVLRRSPQVEADIGRDHLCNPGDTYAEYQTPTQLHRSSTTRVDVVAQRTETVDAGPGKPDPAVESFRAPAFTHAVTETGNAQADLMTVTAYVVAEIRSTRSSRSGSSGSLVIAILRSKTNQPAPIANSSCYLRRAARALPGHRASHLARDRRSSESRDPGWRTCRARRPTRAARVPCQNSLYMR